MKIRHSFISNSSSQSFIVVGKEPPTSISYIQIKSKQLAKRLLKRAYKDIEDSISFYKEPSSRRKELENRRDHVKKIAGNPTLYNIYLTQFISDGSHLFDLRYESGAHWYTYCHGGHEGPYSEEYYTLVTGKNKALSDIWILNEDISPSQQGQQEFSFVEEELEYED